MSNTFKQISPQAQAERRNPVEGARDQVTSEPTNDDAAKFMEPIENARVLNDKIKAQPNEVFFYPAGMYDGVPLRQFASLCDTFIYCDVAFNPADLIGGLQTMMSNSDAQLALSVTIEEVAVDVLGLGLGTPPAWLLRYISPQCEATYNEATAIVRQHGSPSGRKIECSIAERKITVYFFCAEACHAYAALFSRQNAAPKAVCLKQHVPGQHRFLDMDNWDAPLGRAVADSPQPELLVVGSVRRDNWPWKTVWHQFKDGSVAYQRQASGRTTCNLAAL